MKNLALSLLLLVGNLTSAQTDVILKIDHKLGDANFELGLLGTNNLGNEFTASRLEYYMTRITIIAEDGAEIAVPDEVVALVNPGDEISTSIPLGNYDITDVIGVRFHIGVYAPVNNADPSLYAEDNPLALQSPSMHWNWALGYKFLAFDGANGTDLSQVFSVHGANEENYFEVGANVETTIDGSNLIATIEGDYSKGLTDIDLDVDFIIIDHGGLLGIKALENWRDHVFGEFTAGIETLNTDEVQLVIYPNPSEGNVRIILPQDTEINSISISNAVGEIVQELTLTSDGTIELNLSAVGVYFISAFDDSGVKILTERIVIQ